MIYGVAAAILWGLGDLLAKALVDQMGTRAALARVQGTGALLAVLATFAAGVTPSVPAWPALGFMAITICANALSIAFLYAAMDKGKAVLAVPLATCSGAVSLLLSIASGTTVSSMPTIGLLLMTTMAAMAMGIESRSGDRSRPTMILATASALYGGIATWLSGRWMDSVSIAVTGAVASMVVLSIVSMSMAENRAAIRPRTCVPTIFAAAVANVGGYAAFLAGVLNGRLDETGVLATLSGAVAATGATVLLRERLSRVQTVGLIVLLMIMPLLAVSN